MPFNWENSLDSNKFYFEVILKKWTQHLIIIQTLALQNPFPPSIDDEPLKNYDWLNTQYVKHHAHHQPYMSSAKTWWISRMRLINLNKDISVIFFILRSAVSAKQNKNFLPHFFRPSELFFGVFRWCRWCMSEQDSVQTVLSFELSLGKYVMDHCYKSEHLILERTGERGWHLNHFSTIFWLEKTDKYFLFKLNQAIQRRLPGQYTVRNSFNSKL